MVDAIITPTVLYGCEVWAMTKERQLKLRTAQRKMFRQLTQAHRHHPNYPDHISWLRASTKKVEETMANHGIASWTRMQRERSWTWAAKVATASDARWSTVIANWVAPGERPRGRPNTRWSDVLNAFFAGADWRQVARNQDQWHELLPAFIAFADISENN